MNFLRTSGLGLAALLLLTAGGKKPDLSVRFHAEARQQDTERFAIPIDMKYPPRKAFIEKVPIVSERNIRGIYPFEARDGSWGCLFALDEGGTMSLSLTTQDRRGSSLVAFVGTKKGSHQVIDMLIDKPVSDGMITIQQGLTEGEIEMLRKQFKPLMAAGAKR